MNAVNCNSRNVGDQIEVIDCFGGHNRINYIGTISKITKAFITVSYLGSEYRFHRATGFIVGYVFPSFEFAIAPESSK